MKVKNKITISLFFLTSCILAIYCLRLSLRPVEIMAVHQDGNFSDVLVKNFPVSNKGKIRWWLSNKEMLKSNYNIPQKSSYGSFYITFWDFADGYKELGKYDRRCFVDMNTTRNCIDKNAVFSVENYKTNGEIFTVYDGTYLMNEKGVINKIN